MPILGVFPYKEIDDKGLFSFLRESEKFPILSNIIVKNSSLKSSYDTLKPFGIGNKFSWHSLDEENSWLMILFPNFRVKVMSYSMQSYDQAFPTSWSLEARNSERESWVNVSYVKGRTTLASDHLIHVNCNKSKFYQMYRIRMYGKRIHVNNYYVDYSFEILLLEFFGLIATNIYSYSDQKKYFCFWIFYILFLIIEK